MARWRHVSWVIIQFDEITFDGTTILKLGNEQIN